MPTDRHRIGIGTITAHTPYGVIIRKVIIITLLSLDRDRGW
jgi:hypothetical protein